ncbi:MAG: DUF2723 domain-containing protein, partial [Candidatus Lindowbacteria bacterium]|nr:DUF2723 domain-containing protein [Candidatus Lindowbacteria bacterium]
MNCSTFRKHAGWLAFGFCLLIYTLTLCPTVYWDDAGELITVAYTLGIPHPPGHPLYAIIGKIFTFIPFGSIAWRVNFMSAFFGALTCALVYKIIFERLEESRWTEVAALGGAFFFAFTSTVWDQATVAETSTLHSFFMMSLTLLAFRLASGKILWKSERRSLCLFTFLYGFSLTNHVAGVFFFPAFLYLFTVTFKKRIYAPLLLLEMAVSFFVGLLVYAYLPIRSLANPPIDWGNPENLDNFLWVVTAKQYARNLLTKPSFAAIVGNLIVRAQDLVRQFTVVGCTFGAVGLLKLRRTQGRVVVFCLLVITLLFYIGLNSAFISAYFIPALALMAIWIGVGIQQALVLLPRFLERIKETTAVGAAKRVLYGALAVSFALPLGLHYGDMDRSKDTHALLYGEQILEQLPPRSALFTVDGYALFILWYLAYCENRRPDVMAIEPSWVLSGSVLRSQVLKQYPDLVQPSQESTKDHVSRGTTFNRQRNLAIQAVMDANYDARPIFWGVITQDMPFCQNLIPQGIVFRYSREPVVLDEEIISRNRKFWESELASAMRYRRMDKDKVTREIYPVELNNLGMMFEQIGRDDLCRWAFELALKFNPNFPPTRYNLARLESRAGRYDTALREYKRAIEGNRYMQTAYYGLGNTYRQLRQYDEAFLAYRMAIRLKGDYYEAMTAQGQLYALVGRNDDAIEKFQKALEIEPTYAFAHRGLASVHLKLNRLEDARQALNNAMEFDPESPATLFLLARYCARVGNEKQAALMLKRSIATGGEAYLADARKDADLMPL